MREPGQRIAAGRDQLPRRVQFDGDDSEQSLPTSRVTGVDVPQRFSLDADRPRSLEDVDDAEIEDVESPEDVDVSLEGDVSAEDEPGLGGAEDDQDATDQDEAESDEPESDAPANAGAADSPAGL